MSHAGSWRAACSTTIRFLWFHFETHSAARGVTDPGVGSGALLGFALVGTPLRLSIGRTRDSPQTAFSYGFTERDRLTRVQIRLGLASQEKRANTNGAFIFSDPCIAAAWSNFCPTSKMSHDGTWRASCRITSHIPIFDFGSTLHRTRRDKSRRWLWRLVGPV